MNAELFSEAMGKIDGRYIGEAISYHKKAGKSPWLKWGSLAACFGLMTISAFAVMRYVRLFDADFLQPLPDSSVQEELPSKPSDPVDFVASDIPVISSGSASASVDSVVSESPAISSGSASASVESAVSDSPAAPSSSAASVSIPSQEDTAKKSDSTAGTGRIMSPNVIIYETMTWKEARNSEPFGRYMLLAAPAGFYGESFRRYKDDFYDFLSGLWSKADAYDEISWRVCFYNETMESRVTSVEDTRNYDLSLYPIPLADSVPEELYQIVNHPIFNIDELTLEAVTRRAYTIEDSGDSKGFRMSFGVRYGDFVVELSAKGVSPEWAYEQLTALQQTESDK